MEDAEFQLVRFQNQPAKGGKGIPDGEIGHRKCGFHEEGFLRKHFPKDGKFLDARLFALLK
jgi:hypothetical protein